MSKRIFAIRFLSFNHVRIIAELRFALLFAVVQRLVCLLQGTVIRKIFLLDECDTGAESNRNAVRE